jgi:hypothetical protein
MRLTNNQYGGKVCLDHHAPHEVDAYPCTGHGGDIWEFEIVGDADAESGGRLRLFNSRFGEKDCLDHHGEDGTVAAYPCDNNGGDDWTYNTYPKDGQLRWSFNSAEENETTNSTLAAANSQVVSANGFASTTVRNWKIFSGYACHWPYQEISTAWECNEAAQHVQSNHLAVDMNVPSAEMNPHGCYIYGNSAQGYFNLYYNYRGTTSGSWSNRNVICKEGAQCIAQWGRCFDDGRQIGTCCPGLECKEGRRRRRRPRQCA